MSSLAQGVALRGSVASSDAHDRTCGRALVAAWVRYWKKSASRPCHAGSSPTFSRAYISTSSIRTSVERSSFWRECEQFRHQVFGRSALALLVLLVGCSKLQTRRRRRFETQSRSTDSGASASRPSARGPPSPFRRRACRRAAPPRALVGGFIPMCWMNSFTAGRSGRLRRVADQMPQRDQRVGLAAAVGQFELADGLVALAGQPQ